MPILHFSRKRKTEQIHVALVEKDKEHKTNFSKSQFVICCFQLSVSEFSRMNILSSALESYSDKLDLELDTDDIAKFLCQVSNFSFSMHLFFF